MTTNLAAAAATLVTLIVTWVRYGKPDISMTMNGALAGLVAITASCDVVNDYEALFIGAVAGVVVVFAVEFFDKVVKIDDPVGAISVHGVCGALGTLFTGIFGEGCSFIIQLIGFVAVAAYTLILAFILFFVLKKTIGLRVTEKEEIDGLDMHEHGCSAYANFHFQLQHRNDTRHLHIQSPYQDQYSPLLVLHSYEYQTDYLPISDYSETYKLLLANDLLHLYLHVHNLPLPYLQHPPKVANYKHQ